MGTYDEGVGAGVGVETLGELYTGGVGAGVDELAGQETCGNTVTPTLLQTFVPKSTTSVND